MPARSTAPINVRIKQGDGWFYITTVHSLQSGIQAGQNLVHIEIVAARVAAVKPLAPPHASRKSCYHRTYLGRSEHC